MKKLTNQDYAQALFEATKGMSASELQKVVREFANLLVRRRKVGALDDIIKRFNRIAEKDEGVVNVEVTTAHDLTEELRGQIVKAFGGKVKITEEKDPSILGGIVVKTADVILDGSLRAQLTKLKQSIV